MVDNRLQTKFTKIIDDYKTKYSRPELILANFYQYRFAELILELLLNQLIRKKKIAMVIHLS